MSLLVHLLLQGTMKTGVFHKHPTAREVVSHYCSTLTCLSPSKINITPYKPLTVDVN